MKNNYYIKYISKRERKLHNKFMIICILFILWIVISFIDVNIQNRFADDVSIGSWNFFSILMGVME